MTQNKSNNLETKLIEAKQIWKILWGFLYFSITKSKNEYGS